MYTMQISLSDARRGPEPEPKTVPAMVPMARMFEETVSCGSVTQNGLVVHLTAIAAGYYSPDLYCSMCATLTQMTFTHESESPMQPDEERAMVQHFCEKVAPRIIGEDLQRAKTMIYAFDVFAFNNQCMTISDAWQERLRGIVERYNKPVTLPNPTEGDVA